MGTRNPRVLGLQNPRTKGPSGREERKQGLGQALPTGSPNVGFRESHVQFNATKIFTSVWGAVPLAATADRHRGPLFHPRNCFSAFVPSHQRCTRESIAMREVVYLHLNSSYRTDDMRHPGNSYSCGVIREHCAVLQHLDLNVCHVLSFYLYQTCLIKKSTHRTALDPTNAR